MPGRMEHCTPKHWISVRADVDFAKKMGRRMKHCTPKHLVRVRTDRGQRAGQRERRGYDEKAEKKKTRKRTLRGYDEKAEKKETRKRTLENLRHMEE